MNKSILISRVRLITVCVMLLPGIGSSRAQTVFHKTYEGGGSNDYGRSVQQTSDGGYIITGLATPVPALYLVKTNSLGDTLWTRKYGGAALAIGYSVQQCSDDGYIIAGSTSSDYCDDCSPTPPFDVYLIRTNAQGDSLWTRTYGGAGPEAGYSVQQCFDGGYIIGGTTWSFGAGNDDVYLIKTDSLGDTLWTHTYGGAGSEDGYSVRQTSDSGYIITGSTSSFGAGSWDVYLIKTNSLGDTLWTRSYGGTSSDYGRSVQLTSDGGYIVAGGESSFGAGPTDVYLIKTSSLGDTLWTRTFGGVGNEDGYSVQQSSDGGYIVAGGESSFGAGGMDLYLIKTNSLGDTLWTRTYGTAAFDDGYSVQQTSDGGYIVAGENSGDVYLVKTDANGIVTGVTDNSLREVPSEFLLKQNYPNPFNPSTTINYELPSESQVSLKVYNLFGQEVATLVDGKQEAGYKTVEWSPSTSSGQVPSGVYFYRLRAGNVIEIRKFVLVK